MKRTLIAFAVLLVAGNVATSQKWEPYKFKGNERYEYKMTHHDENKGDTTITYILDIREVGTPSEKGEKTWDISWTVKRRVKAKDFNEKAIFNAWGTFGISPGWIVMNPMFSSLVKKVDIKTGAKEDMFGQLVIEVGEKVTIAELEGHVVKLTAKKKGEMELIAEWVLKADIPLPLKSIMYKKGKPQYSMELLKYEKR